MNCHATSFRSRISFPNKHPDHNDQCKTHETIRQHHGDAWTLLKHSGIGTDHSRSGTTYWPMSESSRTSKSMIGFTPSSASAASKSRSTTSKVGDFRWDSYSETDDCWVPAHTASWRWDRPAALRATSMTVFVVSTATEYRRSSIGVGCTPTGRGREPLGLIDQRGAPP